MTPSQIGLLLFLAIIVVLCIYSLTTTRENVTNATIVWAFVTFILFLIVSLQTVIINQADDKCPQYEKVENVYKLKPN